MTAEAVAVAGRREREGSRRGRARPWLYLLPAAAVLVPMFGYPVYMLGLLSVFDYRQAQVSGDSRARSWGSRTTPRCWRTAGSGRCWPRRSGSRRRSCWPRWRSARHWRCC
ncbi:hypothetical protein ACFQYP_62930 [Nonomuraea antimicrobica]